jgi:hypothetical protein
MPVSAVHILKSPFVIKCPQCQSAHGLFFVEHACTLTSLVNLARDGFETGFADSGEFNQAKDNLIGFSETLGPVHSTEQTMKLVRNPVTQLLQSL